MGKYIGKSVLRKDFLKRLCSLSILDMLSNLFIIILSIFLGLNFDEGPKKSPFLIVKNGANMR